MSEEQKSQALIVRSANRVNETTFERIWKFYFDKGKIELSEKEEEIRARLLNVWDLITGQILTDRKAVLAHIKWCEDHGYKIKERIAYEDLRYSKKLFGDRKNSNKERERTIIAEILFNAMAIALEKKDLDSLAKLTRRYTAVTGLELHVGKDVETQEPIPIKFVGDPEALKLQIAEARRKVEALHAQDIQPEP